MEREEIKQEVRAELMQSLAERFGHEKESKLTNYRQQNTFIQKGRTLFTGSSLMENFPITEYCLNEGLPIAYNRGIGGYTTDEFLAAIDTVMLDLQPVKLFINIGTNDLRPMPEGEDWFTHLSANYRKICEIIREKLPSGQQQRSLSAGQFLHGRTHQRKHCQRQQDGTEPGRRIWLPLKEQ